jgi:chaperonin GroES
MYLKLLGNVVAIADIKEDEFSAGGILMPKSNDVGKPVKGLVLAVGRGSELGNGTFHPLPIKVGEIILYQKHKCKSVPYNGKILKIVGEDEIIGVVEENET